MRNVYDNRNYTFKDAVGNWGQFHHNRLCLGRVQSAQSWMTMTFPEHQNLPINLDVKPGELIDPKAFVEPTPSSDGDVAIVQVASQTPPGTGLMNRWWKLLRHIHPNFSLCTSSTATLTESGARILKKL